MSDKKYIILFEDGEARVAAEISEENKRAADDGVVDIIRLSDLSRYIGLDNWERIKSV